MLTVCHTRQLSYSLSTHLQHARLIMAALCNRADHYIFALWFLSSSSFYLMQKSRQKSPSGHHRTTSSGYIFATIWHISTIGKKNLLSSNISSTCPHNTVNFGQLAAEIVSLVWGTPANFNWFRVLAALLHGTLVVGVSQTAALNRGRHLHSTGRPSRWALAHISSIDIAWRLCRFDM